MKPRTRAQKRRRRGPPILAATDREPNGRKSRRKESQVLHERQNEFDNVRTAAETRMRHFNLSTVEQARDPRNGYVLGRMFLDGTVTERQHVAGIRYAEDMARYYGLTGIAFPSARAQDLFAVRGSDGEDSASKGEKARKASQRMARLRTILLACGDIDTGRRVQHTVNIICVENVDERRHLPANMVAWLKRGLNALATEYGCS